MRIWLSLFLVAALLAIHGQPIWAQRESNTGKVAARRTGIEVVSPFTARHKVEPHLAQHFDARVIEYVEKMLRDYDKDKNGLIDKEEWKDGKWSTPPEESDTNQDEALSKLEMCVRIAKRFGLEVPVSALAAADAKPAARKLIAFEFVVIERTGADLPGGKDKIPTAEELLKLEKDGKAGSVQRLKLTALENVEARLQLGEDAPFISGRNALAGGRGGFGGAVQESVTYNSLGTTITLTAETEADGKVLASINLARSTVAAPAKAPEKGEAETGVSANYPRRLQSTVVSTIRITPGETAVVAGQQTHTGSSPGELWVLVTAKVE